MLILPWLIQNMIFFFFKNNSWFESTFKEPTLHLSDTILVSRFQLSGFGVCVPRTGRVGIWWDPMLPGLAWAWERSPSDLISASVTLLDIMGLNQDGVWGEVWAVPRWGTGVQRDQGWGVSTSGPDLWGWGNSFLGRSAESRWSEGILRLLLAALCSSVTSLTKDWTCGSCSRSRILTTGPLRKSQEGRFSMHPGDFKVDWKPRERWCAGAGSHLFTRDL